MFAVNGRTTGLERSGITSSVGSKSWDMEVVVGLEFQPWQSMTLASQLSQSSSLSDIDERWASTGHL